MAQLPDLEGKSGLFDLPEVERARPGNRACSGCGLTLAYRHALKALGPDAIVAVPASCLTVLHGMYPVTSVEINCVNTPFAATAAFASGLAAGLKATGREGITVVGFAGDGGTNDIGIQALSGAAERNTDFIYICYDNEAYMNTGGQRSSSTPLGAKTSTTPILNKRQHPKDMPRIMAAHNIPYVATAASSYPLDLYDKLLKAKSQKGTRYIHISAPCPPGWVYPTADTVKMGKLSVECGLIVLYEIEEGVFRLTARSRILADRGKLKPVEEYLRAQGRFAGITDDQLAELQRWVNRRWEEYRRISA
ncbi:MAG: thiamine pyrophosphate-dependent enzyme [Dehalococcoidia bacterium]|nr:thiamine pyrophosphate-dependent enzyme [Dehalococcoidia bacterium]